MAVHVVATPLYFVLCDCCGEPAGDVGVPVEAYFTTREDAIDGAVGSGWTRTDDDQLLCPDCVDASSRQHTPASGPGN